MTEFSLTGGEAVTLAVLACLVAGFVRGFSGFGGPAVFLLVLTPFFTPASLVTQIMLIDVAANSYLVPASYRTAERRVVLPLVLGALLTLPVGVYAMTALDPVWLKRGIGALTALSTLALLSGWRLRRPLSTAALFALGLVTGLIAGATYLVVHMVVVLLAAPVAAATSRANFIVATFVIALAMIALHTALGFIDQGSLAQTLLLALVYTAAAGAGAWSFARTAEQRYRRLVLWLLVALAAVTMLG